MYVLTRAINDYDQYGEYLETVFQKQPTLQELSNFFYFKELEELDDEAILFLAHLRKGGGRQDTENTWYFLTEIKHGEKYAEH